MTPPRFPPRRPSQWNNIADPALRGNAVLPSGSRVADHFHGPTSRLPSAERDTTAGFVTVDGRIPPRTLAGDPAMAANPTNAVRLSGGGLHAEDVVIQTGDLRNAVQDAAEQALRTGDRVPVNIVINRSPCNTRCPTTISTYVTRELPGALVRPPHVSQVDWDAALRNVDIELHVPHAYEPPNLANRTTTGDLLHLENSGVRVVVYQPRPGQYRPGNAGGGGRGAGGNDGGSGEALNDTLTHLDDYRIRTGDHQPRHWTEAGDPPGGLSPTGPASPDTPTGPSGLRGPDPVPDTSVTGATARADVPADPAGGGAPQLRTDAPSGAGSPQDPAPAAPQARTDGPQARGPDAEPATRPADNPAAPIDETPTVIPRQNGPAARGPDDGPRQQPQQQQQFQQSGPRDPGGPAPLDTPTPTPAGADLPSVRPDGPPPADMPPARELDNEGGWRYGREAWDGVADRLTPPQRDALLDYGGSAHMGINGNLRYGFPRRSEFIADQINALDDALRHVPTPEPVRVVRVTSSRAYDRPMDQIAGTPQSDPGYLSTRLGDNPTHGSPDEMWDGRNLVIAHTYVPAGTPGIFMNHVAPYLRGGELLLGRDLPRFVTNARQIDGVWHVDEVIYPPHTYSPPARVHPEPPPDGSTPSSRPVDDPGPLGGPAGGRPNLVDGADPVVPSARADAPSGTGSAEDPAPAAPQARTDGPPAGTTRPADPADSTMGPPRPGEQPVAEPVTARHHDEPADSTTSQPPGGRTAEPPVGGRPRDGTGQPVHDEPSPLAQDTPPARGPDAEPSTRPADNPAAPIDETPTVIPRQNGPAARGPDDGPRQQPQQQQFQQSGPRDPGANDPAAGGPRDPGDPAGGGTTPPPPTTRPATSTPPRRVPSRWEDIADPRFARNDNVTARFRDHDAWEQLSGTQKKRTGAFVTVDGHLPNGIVPRTASADEAVAGIRYSGKGGNHAEDKVMDNGDIAIAVREAAENALADTGRRVTVRVVVSRSPCGTKCSFTLPDYVRTRLPGEVATPPPGISQAEWDVALRRVDLELHTPHAYEGNVGDTATSDLLRLESSGLRVVVYQESPGVFRLGNDHGGAPNMGGEGSGGGALHDTLKYLDQYRADYGVHPPRHWTEAGNPPPPGSLPPAGTPRPPSGPTNPPGNGPGGRSAPHDSSGNGSSGDGAPTGDRSADQPPSGRAGDDPAARATDQSPAQPVNDGPTPVAQDPSPARPGDPSTTPRATDEPSPTAAQDPTTVRPGAEPTARPGDQPTTARAAGEPSPKPLQDPPATRPADSHTPADASQPGPRVEPPTTPVQLDAPPTPARPEFDPPEAPRLSETPLGARVADDPPTAPIRIEPDSAFPNRPRAADHRPARPESTDAFPPRTRPNAGPNTLPATDAVGLRPPVPQVLHNQIPVLPPPRLDPNYRPVSPQKSWREKYFPKLVKVAPAPPPPGAPPGLDLPHQIDWLIQNQGVRPRFIPAPDDVGRRVSDLYPQRFVSDPIADQRLADAVAQFGRDNPADWIRYINPNFGSGRPNAFGTNCTDGMRAYATTRQTNQAYAASGDRAFFESNLTPWWAGTMPSNTIYAQGLGDLGPFQQRAWDQVALQLQAKPPGTVAEVYVFWEPIVVNGRAFRGPAHVLGAEVAPNGSIKWVDPQSHVHTDWPPTYPTRVISVSSVYRSPVDLQWRNDSPMDVSRALPMSPGGMDFRPTTPVAPFQGGTLATHEGLPSLSGGMSGHTLGGYTGVSETTMATRLAQQPDLPSTSTFVSAGEADTWVYRTLAMNHVDVNTWMQSTTDMRLTVDLDFAPANGVTGRVMTQGQTRSVPASGVRVVLERRPPGSWPAFLVVKAHPTSPLVP